jgi:hypothetical protein
MMKSYPVLIACALFIAMASGSIVAQTHAKVYRVGLLAVELPLEQPTRFHLAVNLKDRQGAWHQDSQLDAGTRRHGDRINLTVRRFQRS